MKNQDDGTLSLFDDFPSAPAPAATAPKKPRAKRKASEPKVDVVDAASGDVTHEAAAPIVLEAAPPVADVVSDVQSSTVETTLHLAGLVEPQRRRNSPWANLDLTASQAAAKVPHVMLAITKGKQAARNRTCWPCAKPC